MRRLQLVFTTCAALLGAGCGSDDAKSSPEPTSVAESAIATVDDRAARPARPAATRSGRYSRIPPDRIDPARREAAESFARSYEQSRAQGTFAPLGEEATDEMRTSLTVQKQQDAQRAIEERFGKFEALELVEAWKINASPGSTIYRFRGTFTNGRPEIRVVHDAKGKVSGYWIKPWRDSLEPRKPKKLPENQVNTALREASREFAVSYLEQRNAGRFEPLGNQVTDQLRAALTPDVQQQSHEEISARVGQYLSLEYVETYRLPDEPGTTIFRFRAKFTRGRPEVRVVRDAEGKVSGFWIKPWRAELD